MTLKGHDKGSFGFIIFDRAEIMNGAPTAMLVPRIGCALGFSMKSPIEIAKKLYGLFGNSLIKCVENLLDEFQDFC
jgi:1,4-dihydroxy-2-naphthoate octaprenyltransferase